MKIQQAQQHDAEALAYLINLAGEGLPEYLWSTMAEHGESAMAVGVRRASREDGGFSYKNARVIKKADTVAAMIISYPLDDPYELPDLDDMPAMVRPLIILESKAPGSWYVNAIATAEPCRGEGLATKLLEDAEAQARLQGIAEMSLIVASENTAAKRLYLSLGYEVRAVLPVITYQGCLHGGDWELMTKPCSR